MQKINAALAVIGIIALSFLMIGAASDRAPNISVPKGAMIPYFGPIGLGELPTGFVLADGKSNWPTDADWVHPDLRGKPVPDMTGEILVGGVLDDVGQPTKKDEELNIEAEVYDLNRETHNFIAIEGTDLEGSNKRLLVADENSATHAYAYQKDRHAQVVIGSGASNGNINDYIGATTLRHHFIDQIANSMPKARIYEKKERKNLSRKDIKSYYMQCNWIIRVE